MTILDSNIWIAYLNKEDRDHRRAIKVFREAKRPLVLPEYVALEVITVLNLKAGRETSVAFAKMASQNKELKLLISNKKLFFNLLVFFEEQAQKDLSFVDMALLYWSYSYQVQTFDKNLEKAIERD